MVRHRGIEDKWCKNLEALGFNLTKKNIQHDMNGTSFSCEVDVIRFLSNQQADDKYPRVREVFKQGDFKIEIIQEKGFASTYGMDVRIENTLQENTDEEDITDLAASVIEGGRLDDKVAELGDVILEVAKNKAREMHIDLINGGN
jgi:hypothetical protein